MNNPPPDNSNASLQKRLEDQRRQQKARQTQEIRAETILKKTGALPPLPDEVEPHPGTGTLRPLESISRPVGSSESSVEAEAPLKPLQPLRPIHPPISGNVRATQTTSRVPGNTTPGASSRQTLTRSAAPSSTSAESVGTPDNLLAKSVSDIGRWLFKHPAALIAIAVMLIGIAVVLITVNPATAPRPVTSVGVALATSEPQQNVGRPNELISLLATVRAIPPTATYVPIPAFSASDAVTYLLGVGYPVDSFSRLTLPSATFTGNSGVQFAVGNNSAAVVYLVTYPTEAAQRADISRLSTSTFEDWAFVTFDKLLLVSAPVVPEADINIIARHLTSKYLAPYRPGYPKPTATPGS